MRSQHVPVDIAVNKITSCFCGANWLGKSLFEWHLGDSQAFLYSATQVTSSPQPALIPPPQMPTTAFPTKREAFYRGCSSLPSTLRVAGKAFLNPNCFIRLLAKPNMLLHDPRSPNQVSQLKFPAFHVHRFHRPHKLRSLKWWWLRARCPRTCSHFSLYLQKVGRAGIDFILQMRKPRLREVNQFASKLFSSRKNVALWCQKMLALQGTISFHVPLCPQSLLLQCFPLTGTPFLKFSPGHSVFLLWLQKLQRKAGVKNTIYVPAFPQVHSWGATASGSTPGKWG